MKKKLKHQSIHDLMRSFSKSSIDYFDVLQLDNPPQDLDLEFRSSSYIAQKKWIQSQASLSKRTQKVIYLTWIGSLLTDLIKKYPQSPLIHSEFNEWQEWIQKTPEIRECAQVRYFDLPEDHAWASILRKPSSSAIIKFIQQQQKLTSTRASLSQISKTTSFCDAEGTSNRSLIWPLNPFFFVSDDVQYDQGLWFWMLPPLINHEIDQKKPNFLNLIPKPKWNEYSSQLLTRWWLTRVHFERLEEAALESQTSMGLNTQEWIQKLAPEPVYFIHRLEQYVSQNQPLSPRMIQYAEHCFSSYGPKHSSLNWQSKMLIHWIANQSCLWNRETCSFEIDHFNIRRPDLLILNTKNPTDIKYEENMLNYFLNHIPEGSQTLQVWASNVDAQLLDYQLNSNASGDLSVHDVETFNFFQDTWHRIRTRILPSYPSENHVITKTRRL